MRNDGMVVDIVVKVKVADHEPEYRVSEERLEDEAVSVVAECLSKERTIDFQEASLLEFDHCKWVFEVGMPLDCGHAEPVRLFTDGSWRYPNWGNTKHNGPDFQSLSRFVQLARGS